jgi:hypothetical protein
LEQKLLWLVSVVVFAIVVTIAFAGSCGGIYKVQGGRMVVGQVALVQRIETRKFVRFGGDIHWFPCRGSTGCESVGSQLVDNALHMS